MPAVSGSARWNGDACLKRDQSFGAPQASKTLTLFGANIECTFFTPAHYLADNMHRLVSAIGQACAEECCFLGVYSVINTL